MLRLWAAATHLCSTVIYSEDLIDSFSVYGQQRKLHHLQCIYNACLHVYHSRAFPLHMHTRKNKWAYFSMRVLWGVITSEKYLYMTRGNAYT